MKFLTFTIGTFTIAVNAVIQYEQAAHLKPHLAPRITDQTPTEAVITLNDTLEKNFTHSELFTLQKKFLDNFIAPNNALQVSVSFETPP